LEVVELPLDEDFASAADALPKRAVGLFSGMLYIISTSLREDAKDDREEIGELIDSK
jgi:hypothetical protein